MNKRVIIIGGGWSGLYALKHILEEGLTPILLEERNKPFGVWHYRKLPGGVLRNTHATSSKIFMQPSDFPFSEKTPLFPHHDIIENHLENYFNFFNLSSYIRFNHKVDKVRKVDNLWKVFSNGKEFEAEFLIITTGLNSVPNIPKDKIYQDFSGKLMHTHYFSEKTKKELKDKNVLIVGGGETACDIANILSNESKVFLSIRNGQWFQDRIAGGNEATDVFYNRLIHSNVVTILYAINFFKKEMEFWWGKGGSGVKIWEPNTAYFNGFYNKSRDVIQKIAQGQIFPKKGIKNIKKNKVFFENEETPENIDYILFGTGYNYKAGLNFLPSKIIDTKRYKHIFYPEDPSLAFIGYVRPYLGSIPMLSELQSRYVSKVFSNSVKLPKQNKMNQEIKRDIKKQKKMFPKDSKRMPFLVNPFSYSDEIAKKINAKPKMGNLLFVNPYLWWCLLLQTWSPFQYRIYDSNKNKKKVALEEIKKLQSNPTSVKLRKKIFKILLGCIIFLILFTLSIYALTDLFLIN